ncbi:hypothetical protein RvY_17931 [Ramazzottius varieornatus]|uniref:PPM-type phosphatase domain-containing protein n=1 Tax=Ramazzottius varieornatus TaxID=947166 RepID=A0A1D1W5V6_RAMVA|nr:hypothetical protein RvY_17931 [Ramazzottius varieornatus]
MEESNGPDTSRQHLGRFLRSLNELKPPLEAISELAKHEKVDGRGSWTAAECSSELIYWIQLYLTHLGCPLEYCIPCARAIVNNVLDSHDFHMADFEAPLPQLAAMDSNDTDETWKQLSSLNGTNGHDENGTTLNGESNNKESGNGAVISAKNLYGHAVQKANEMLTRWKEDLPHFEPMAAPHRVSAYAIKNKRPGMEDRHVIIPDLRAIVDLKGIKSPVSFYAVYDGHAGAVAAAYAAAHLHHSLCASPNYPDQMEKALKEAFVATDEQYEKKGSRDKDYSGTTAVVSVVYEEKLYIAWVGDSEAAIIVNRHADKLVEPRHTAENEVERKRVQDDGGTVIFNQGGWRVGAVLTVTRAIGDSGFKPFVTSNPDIRTINLDGSEDYLILACDGLWDELTPEDAMNTTNRFLLRNPTNPDDVAKELADKAKRSGSLDNISVLVVFLQPVEEIVGKLQAQRDEQRETVTPPMADNVDDFADLVDVNTNVDFVVDYETQHNNPFDTTPLDSSVLGDFGTPNDRSASEVDWDFERVPVNQYREEESQALNFLDEAIVSLDQPSSPSSHKPASVTPTEDVRREFSRDEEGRPIVITHDGQDEEQTSFQGEHQHSEQPDDVHGRNDEEAGRPAQEEKVEKSLEQDYAEFQQRSSSQNDQLLTDQDAFPHQKDQSNQQNRNDDSFDQRVTELQSTVQSNAVSVAESTLQPDDLTTKLNDLKVSGEPNSGSAPLPSGNTTEQTDQPGTNIVTGAIVAAAAGLGTAVGFIQSALHLTSSSTSTSKTPTKTSSNTSTTTKKTPQSPATPTSASSKRTPSSSSKSTTATSSTTTPSSASSHSKPPSSLLSSARKTPTGTTPQKTPSSTGGNIEVPRTPPKTVAEKKPIATPRTVPTSTTKTPNKTASPATSTNKTPTEGSPVAKKPIPATPRSSAVAVHPARTGPPPAKAKASPLSVSHKESKETSVGQSSSNESSSGAIDTSPAQNVAGGTKSAAAAKKPASGTESTTSTKRATPPSKLSTSTAPSAPKTPRAAPAVAASTTSGASARSGTAGATSTRTTTAGTTPRTARPTPSSTSKLPPPPSASEGTRKAAVPTTPSAGDTMKKPAIPATPRSAAGGKSTTSKTSTTTSGLNGTAEKAKSAVKKPTASSSKTSSTTTAGKATTVKADKTEKKEENAVASTGDGNFNGHPEKQDSQQEGRMDSAHVDTNQSQNVDSDKNQELLTF